MLGESGGSLDSLATFFEKYFQLNLGTCQTETASQFLSAFWVELGKQIGQTRQSVTSAHTLFLRCGTHKNYFEQEKESSVYHPYLLVLVLLLPITLGFLY